MGFSLVFDGLCTNRPRHWTVWMSGETIRCACRSAS